MKKIKIILPLLLLLASAGLAVAQCDVRQRIMPDGSMYSYVAPVLLYQTSERMLQGGVMTDGENYFLELRVTPKLASKPDKANLTLRLSNRQSYKLDMFDMRTSANDSSLVMTFLLPKNKVEDFAKNEVDRVEIIYDQQSSTDNVYTLKLHRALIREHLACLKSKK